MTTIRKYYRILRSVLFTAIVFVVALYIGLYVLISVPSFQNYVKNTAENELTKLLGGEVSIGKVEFFPFNEVRLSDVSLKTPRGEKCVSIGKLGAGIHLWRLIADRKVEITYAEIVRLEGRVWQQNEGDPLNIQFIIDALAPKDKNKPPTKFDLKIHNIVIRRSALTFDRRWRRIAEDSLSRFNPDHIAISDLRADVTLPQVRNNDFVVDLRRLSFKERSGLDVTKISALAHITDHSLSVNDLIVNIGTSRLRTSDIALNFKSFKEIKNALRDGSHFVQVIGEDISPADFGCFEPVLRHFPGVYYLSLTAEGNMASLGIKEFSLIDNEKRIRLTGQASAQNLDFPESIEGDISDLKFEVSSARVPDILDIIPGLSQKAREMALKAGGIELLLNGSVSLRTSEASADAEISTGLGDIDVSADGHRTSGGVITINAEAATSDFDLGALLDDRPIGHLGAEITAAGTVNGKNIDGRVEANVDYIELQSSTLYNVSATVDKKGSNYLMAANVEDQTLYLDAAGEMTLAGEDSHYRIDAEIDRMEPGEFGLKGKFADCLFSCTVSADITGNNPDNLTGDAMISDVVAIASDGRSLNIRELSASIEERDSIRMLDINSDFLTAHVQGDLRLSSIVPAARYLASAAVPSLLETPQLNDRDKRGKFEFAATVAPDDNLYSFMNTPVRPLSDIDMSGEMDMEQGSLRFSLSAPYILQGENKLISATNVNLVADSYKGATLNLLTTYPVKNDRANLDLQLSSVEGRLFADIGWKMVNNQDATGYISMDADLVKNELTGKPEVALTVNHSTFRLGSAEWTIGKADIDYTENKLIVDGLRIYHDRQFVEIDGTASADPEDHIDVSLADIDLSYIFDILNINYVTFGGIATGEVTASGVFTKEPVAKTKHLFVKDLSYNGAVLGDAELSSRWNNEEKEVEINADIKEAGYGGALINGGVYVTRDSLSFGMNADRIRIEFLKPFMAAFTSDVGGRASGNVKLFGTFKDIDLVGRVYADSISMKVDYTNVYYHGKDSVYLNPGQIEIPGFRLYDRYGNSAMFSGYVKHRYFHDPEFEFRLSGAKNLLCYDTNPSINPDWYGRIFATGSGTLRGRPGIVSMLMDMTTAANSEFTFVLNETQTALDYTFLTFSDKKKELEEKIEVEESFEERFRKKQEEQISKPTVFSMDLRATVTPEARMTLVMDPAAGDKIEANGSGPLQISYDTESDEMSMYGKYTLASGEYNFSLQELILRQFRIREGSSISFNGDPMRALLDIAAAYRVNTNLSDLDKSFSTDRDLNRTNVPVDALLYVKGDLQNPDISFDISLPTLTSDVERKVKSIVSTDDMMNRQIIYLLALNRFYTPEYMSTSGNGGELASVASSTISSQISNILGQLTDKFTLAPSFRSDKGDFSDTEVDVSLSSRLLNNRLLINGNFGYRDRSTSQTTFVGDFDIEYLLSKNGGLRLKAYNHFNDQQYYLRSALTTQGIGVVYRREFDNPFTFLKRRKKKAGEVKEAAPVVLPEEESDRKQTETDQETKE